MKVLNTEPKLGDLVYRPGRPSDAGKIIELGLRAPLGHSQFPTMEGPAVRVRCRDGSEHVWPASGLYDFGKLLEQTAQTLESHKQLLEHLTAL